MKRTSRPALWMILPFPGNTSDFMIDTFDFMGHVSGCMGNTSGYMCNTSGFMNDTSGFMSDMIRPTLWVTLLALWVILPA